MDTYLLVLKAVGSAFMMFGLVYAYIRYRAPHSVKEARWWYLHDNQNIKTINKALIIAAGIGLSIAFYYASEGFFSWMPQSWGYHDGNLHISASTPYSVIFGMGIGGYTLGLLLKYDQYKQCVVEAKDSDEVVSEAFTRLALTDHISKDRAIPGIIDYVEQQLRCKKIDEEKAYMVIGVLNEFKDIALTNLILEAKDHQNNRKAEPIPEKSRSLTGALISFSQQPDEEEKSSQEVYDDLIKYVKDKGWCPYPAAWTKMYKLLKRNKPKGTLIDPPQPIVLAGWYDTPSLLKASQLLSQIEWAKDKGCLAKLDKFLRNLRDEDWHKQS